MTQDDRDPLPVIPGLAVRPQETEQTSTEQGPAPADFATREAPPIPAPSGKHLGAEEVTALLGDGSEEVEANRALEGAEGLSPDTES
ncbi:hypothetical protein [Deinococcus apachensis]|uniref:hypothetical protein n=1 Tax=Deinococcus apachensis TaxID=309886 RepID=UPI00036C0DAA|nr:hypothetical protein [Deinococcus apachensis]